MTRIEGGTFAQCSSLTSVVIPDSVANIWDDSFHNCSSLTSITFKGTVAQWNAIEKGNDWNSDVPATEVVCSDGKAEL